MLTLVLPRLQVMPFSTGLSTTLSNFEAGLNYQDVSDPSVMVSFPILDDPAGAQLVAWTTTPWTLPSNLALCVHPDFDYVQVKDPASGAVYIVAESRLAALPGAVPKKAKGKGKRAPLATTCIADASAPCIAGATRAVYLDPAAVVLSRNCWSVWHHGRSGIRLNRIMATRIMCAPVAAWHDHACVHTHAACACSGERRL